MKQNRYIIILLLILACPDLRAQYDSAVVEYIDTTYPEPPEISQSYDPLYHFEDSSQIEFNSSELRENFDTAYWRKLTSKMDFEEKIPVKKKDTITKKTNQVSKTKFLNVPNLKFILLALAIAILGFVIIKLWPGLIRSNKKLQNKLIINLDDLDEETLRKMDIMSDLQIALKNGDYRTAYRLRYLAVLKKLIERNLVFYKKEKTNFEYLNELNGIKIYEPFRKLTFNFDGLWYGDLHIDKTIYENLEVHFVEFDSLILSL